MSSLTPNQAEQVHEINEDTDQVEQETAETVFNIKCIIGFCASS